MDARLEPKHESMAAALVLLLLLVFADLGFTVLHLIHVETGWLRGHGISLEHDGGPSEIYQYVKEFWIVVCMVVAFVLTRHGIYLAWAIVFSVLLADDAGQIHENVGMWLGERYQFAAPFGLRSKDVGELLVAGAVGLLTLIVAGAGLCCLTEQCRRISRDVSVLVIFLGVVGILVDVLHVIAYHAQSQLAQVLLVVEDGGEMVVMSALTAYAFHVVSHAARTRFDLLSTVWVRLGFAAYAASATSTRAYAAYDASIHAPHMPSPPQRVGASGCIRPAVLP
jgi:hypothetical protein